MKPLDWNPQLADPPPPGLYCGVPFKRYLGWPYLSNSTLGQFAISPAQCRAVLDGELSFGASDAMLMGSATGALWVEDLTLQEAGIVVFSGASRRGKAWEAFVADNPGRIHVLAKHEAAALGMDKALRASIEAEALKAGCLPEVSLVWDCPETGLRCKGRVDLLDLERQLEIDLKTTRDHRRKSFAKSIADYRYHWQREHYRQGLEVLTGLQDWNHYFIAVRNEPVHSVAVYPVAFAALEAARHELLGAMWRFRECCLADHWPADLTEQSPIDLPGWAYKQGGRV